MEIKMLNRLKL